MGKIQKYLSIAFLCKNPNGTVGEFARFYNQLIVDKRRKSSRVLEHDQRVVDQKKIWKQILALQHELRMCEIRKCLSILNEL